MPIALWNLINRLEKLLLLHSAVELWKTVGKLVFRGKQRS